MADLRTTIKNLLKYDEKKPVNVRPVAALDALTGFLAVNAPEVAEAAAAYLDRQRANGELITEGKQSGKVCVVGYWSGQGTGFIWLREKENVAQAWAEQVAAADRIDGYYAIKFVAEVRELDVPHRVTDDIARLMQNIMDADDTITYSKGEYRKGNDTITKEQADKF